MRFREKIVPLIALAAVICLVILFSAAVSLKGENTDLKSRYKELLGLKEEFLAVKSAVDSVEGKKSAVKVEGVVRAVDEIFGSVGLNQKVKSVKSAGVKDKKYAVEEEAEIQVEKVTMNEIANILYKTENAPMILSIKRTTLKTTFENPALLNITMTMSLIKPK